MRSCAVRCKGTTEEEWNGPGHDTGVAPTLALPVSGPPRSCETSALLQIYTDRTIDADLMTNESSFKKPFFLKGELKWTPAKALL